jgi:hypothetical protein
MPRCPLFAHFEAEPADEFIEAQETRLVARLIREADLIILRDNQFDDDWMAYGTKFARWTSNSDKLPERHSRVVILGYDDYPQLAAVRAMIAANKTSIDASDRDAMGACLAFEEYLT